MREKARQISRIMKILANEYRLLILCELMNGPQTVNGILDRIEGISQSALSQHLAVMKANNVVDYDKKGQNVIYTICDSRVADIIRTLKKYYCS